MSDPGERFPDAVLDVTLAAVRRRHQQKRVIRGVAACALLFAALGFFLIPNGRRPQPAEAVVPLPDPVKVAVEETKPPTVIMFSTKDVKTNVRVLDDAELSAHLADRAHGFYTTSDGKRRLWLPE